MFVWNNSHNILVNLEKIRNIEIVIQNSEIEIIAWVNDQESIKLGTFDDKNKAEEFLDKIIKKQHVEVKKKEIE